MSEMKTFQASVTRIVEASRRLNLLAFDPQPGLATWWLLLRDTEAELAEAVRMHTEAVENLPTKQ